jgi:ABC-2 type transport system permease protein
VRGREITRLVAGREITERVHGRLMRIMTVATAVLVVAAIAIPSLIKSSSAPTKIGLVGARARLLHGALERNAAAANVKIAVSDVADDAQASSEVLDGRLDAALLLTSDSGRIEVKESVPGDVRALLAATVNEAHLRASLARAGVAPAAIASALTPVSLTTAALKPPPADKTARGVAAVAAALLMYLSLAIYGGAVANGVAQEKTSRTAEVLLAAVRPRQLLSGKVIGIGLTGLGQLAVAAAAGLIANALIHSTKIPSSVWVLLPTFLVCFLAGFVLYAFAFAAAGALVARQEELQFVTLPIGLPLLIGYLLVYAAIASPNATWLKVISFFPPLTATLMPARIALGHVAWWELPLAAAIMGASIYLMARVASRVYSVALIQGGARLTWRGALGLPVSG